MKHVLKFKKTLTTLMCFCMRSLHIYELAGAELLLFVFVNFLFFVYPAMTWPSKAVSSKIQHPPNRCFTSSLFSAKIDFQLTHLCGFSLFVCLVFK